MHVVPSLSVGVKMRNLFLCLGLGLLASISVSISGAETPQKVDKRIAQRARLNDEVLRLSQPLKCSSDADCASLPMGSKPCGGPWKYVLYSKKNSKVPALKKKLSEYNKLDQKINEAQQVMSDCSMALEPNLKCEKSMCVDTANANSENAKAGFENVGTAPPKKEPAK
jgi:hypothetical protein